MKSEGIGSKRQIQNTSIRSGTFGGAHPSSGRNLIEQENKKVNRIIVEPTKKRGNMFSFFKKLYDDTSEDMRAAQFIRLFQGIIERNLSNSETKVLRKFYKEMKYPEFMNHQDIAIDYIYFLLNDRRRFPGDKKKFLGMEKKEAIIGNFQSAVQHGLIIGADNYHFALMREVAEVE